MAYYHLKFRADLYRHIQSARGSKIFRHFILYFLPFIASTFISIFSIFFFLFLRSFNPFLVSVLVALASAETALYHRESNLGTDLRDSWIYRHRWNREQEQHRALAR